MPNLNLLRIAEDWVNGWRENASNWDCFSHHDEMNDVLIGELKFEKTMNVNQVVDGIECLQQSSLQTLHTTPMPINEVPPSDDIGKTD